MHVALKALPLNPGDEVIVPAFTWVATAAMVEHCGAVPVFCDIDLATFNLATGSLDALVRERTVGIIPVHLFGLMADMDAVMAFAQRHQLWVLEDAACALGSLFQGKAPGTFGQAACFSFHPRKSITTGEGGMVVMNEGILRAAAGPCATTASRPISGKWRKLDSTIALPTSRRHWARSRWGASSRS